MHLIFPPFVDPRAPFSALPALAGYLRSKHVPVVLHDFNVQWFRTVLTRDYLETRLIRSDVSKYVIENIAEAVAIMRCAQSFERVDRYSWARNLIETSLSLMSATYHGWRLSIDNPGLTDRSLHEAEEIIRENVPNPFSTFLQVWTKEAVRESSMSEPIVGVSVSNMSQLFPGLIIARTAKEVGAAVILGGSTITLLRDIIPAWKGLERFADGAVFFEGEEALHKIWDNYRTGRPLFDAVSNCAFVDGTAVASRASRLSLSLDRLPAPDFSGLPLDQYFAPELVLPVSAGRGCSWGKCEFCSIPTTSSASGLKARDRNVNQVAADLRTLVDRLNANAFFFVDENISAKRLEQISAEILRENIDVKWIAFTRFDRRLTPQLASQLAESGCVKLLIGLESGNDRVLRAMRKGTTVAIARANLDALRRACVAVNLFCMVGFPSETPVEMQETLDFLLADARLLSSPGFSASFSEFILDRWSPLGIQARDATSNAPPIQARAMNPIQEVRRSFNRAVRDAMMPNQMVGWEEHCLLLLKYGASFQVEDGMSVTDLCNQFAKEPFTEIEARPWHRLRAEEAPGQQDGYILSESTGRLLRSGSGVPKLLAALKRPVPIENLCPNPTDVPGNQILRTLALLCQLGVVSRVTETEMHVDA